MDLLKLIALDDDDLKVVSAHLQDAIVRVGDIAFVPRERRFALLLNRFDWITATEKRSSNGSGYERHLCALRFESVAHVQYRGISPERGDDALDLLAIDFAPTDAPSGSVTLHFAGGGAIRLHVDCIEAELRDLGPSWKTPLKPKHPDDRNETNTAS